MTQKYILTLFAQWRIYEYAPKNMFSIALVK